MKITKAENQSNRLIPCNESFSSSRFDNSFKQRIHQAIGNRLEFTDLGSDWISKTVDTILAEFPRENVYTVAAGISPSGIVHFGNMRDVMTSLAVFQELKTRGYNARFIFSWDDYDRFRKVPANIDPSWNQYIGLPISKVPDPHGQESSYARYWEKQFEQALLDLGIDIEYRYQTAEYENGSYSDGILQACENRLTIAEIIFDSMSDKSKEEKKINKADFLKNFSPISIYSRFTGKDNTKILEQNGSLITYYCFDTKKIETVDIRHHHIAKLGWKIDWPMRWNYERVIFEPGGKDHASPNGSYDVSSRISQVIYQRNAPIFVGYEFIGIRGLQGKMSSSAGNSVSPSQLLEIYESTLLKWIYFRKNPSSGFELAFDSEIIRQYDEFDKELESAITNADQNKLKIFRLCGLSIKTGINAGSLTPIPFRQAEAFGQIAQWDTDKTIKLLARAGFRYDPSSIRMRLEKARNWLEKYNPSLMINISTELNANYVTDLDEKTKKHVRTLKDLLMIPDLSLDELERRIYDIPKEDGLDPIALSKLQRTFFKTVYNLLIGKDTGPRLSTFIYLLDRNQILSLLDV